MILVHVVLLSLQGGVCGIEQLSARPRISFTQPHLYATPQHVGTGLRCSTGAESLFWRHRTGAMQNPVSGLPRISLLGTSVNKTFHSHAPEVRSCNHGGGGK